VSPPGAPMSVLVLAGTTEAAELVGLLAADDGVAPVASLAGRTGSPAPFPCPVRTGGFGGRAGLARVLREHPFDVLVDATHPFSARMPHHAADAAATVAIPRLRLVRPPWTPEPGDRWHEVADLADAARHLADAGARRVFLALGRQHLGPFASLGDVEVLVRSIEPPGPLPFERATVVLDRGPFRVDDEVALLRQHRIEVLVTRNSGGTATAAKLAAARTCGVEVVMVSRPPVPAGPTAGTADEAAAWVAAIRAGG
jgi:precorrin-6A/cobalt-precorrin-6A reductase